MEVRQAAKYYSPMAKLDGPCELPAPPDACTVQALVVLHMQHSLVVEPGGWRIVAEVEKHPVTDVALFDHTVIGAFHIGLMLRPCIRVVTEGVIDGAFGEEASKVLLQPIVLPSKLDSPAKLAVQEEVDSPL
jgi:hypothetical protein